MSMNNNNSDLNKFFKSRLEDTTPADNGWNVPPMSILDDALDQLSVPPKRNKLLIPFIILGIIAFGLTAMMIFNSLKISKLNDKLESLTIVDNQSNLETEINGESDHRKIMDASTSMVETVSPIGSEAQRSLIEEEPSSKSKSVTNANQNEQTPSHSQTTQKSRLDQSKVRFGNLVPTSQIFSEREVIKSVSKASSWTKKSHLNQLINNENLIISQPPILKGMSGFDLGKNHIVLQLNDHLSTVQSSLFATKKVKKNRNVSFLFSAGYLGSNVRMTNINPNSFTLTQYENLYPGVGINLGIGLQLGKKFQLRSTIGYESITNESLYQSDFHYDEENTVTTQSGELMHLSNSAVETPMGQFSDELALRFRESNIPNGEMLDQVTSITDDYQIIQLATVLSYEVLRIKKISLHTGFGLSGNYILNFDQSLDTKMLSNTSIMMEEKKITNLAPAVNRYFLSSSLNLGLDYAISPSTYLGIHSSYERGITSIRKQDSKALPQSFLNSIGTELVLGYSF